MTNEITTIGVSLVVVEGPAFNNMNPRDTAHFDIDTGYTAKQANQFQYLIILIGVN
jgi:hypothetical protein